MNFKLFTDRFKMDRFGSRKKSVFPIPDTLTHALKLPVCWDIHVRR